MRNKNKAKEQLMGTKANKDRLNYRKISLLLLMLAVIIVAVIIVAAYLLTNRNDVGNTEVYDLGDGTSVRVQGGEASTGGGEPASNGIINPGVTLTGESPEDVAAREPEVAVNYIPNESLLGWNSDVKVYETYIQNLADTLISDPESLHLSEDMTKRVVFDKSSLEKLFNSRRLYVDGLVIMEETVFVRYGYMYSDGTSESELFEFRVINTGTSSSTEITDLPKLVAFVCNYLDDPGAYQDDTVVVLPEVGNSSGETTEENIVIEIPSENQQEQE
jgi:hypothetical protein